MGFPGALGGFTAGTGRSTSFLGRGTGRRFRGANVWSCIAERKGDTQSVSRASGQMAESRTISAPSPLHSTIASALPTRAHALQLLD